MLRRDSEAPEPVLHDEERNADERGCIGVESRRGILGLGREDGELGHSANL